MSNRHASLVWLDNNNCVIRPNGRAEVTHTCMTGGKFHVPEQMQAAFQQQLADNICGQNSIPCLTEQHSRVFPYYVDFDGQFPTQSIAQRAIEVFISYITQSIRRFFPTEPENTKLFDSIVLGKSGKPSVAKTENGGVQHFKHGLHIHFPELLVNVSQARQMRVGMLDYLITRASWMQEFGDVRPDWNGIIDEAVYDSGLRMMYAPKGKKCPECKGNKNVFACGGCDPATRGYVIDKRFYEFWCAFKNGVVVEDTTPYTNNCQNLFRKTSVRCLEGTVETPGYTVPPGTRLPPMKAKRGRDVEHSAPPQFKRDTIDIDDARKTKILHKYLCGYNDKYNECVITRIVQKVGSGKKEMWVNIAGPGSTFCPNKGDYHNSNRVYMIVKPQPAEGSSRSHAVCKPTAGDSQAHAVLKCYCKCATVRNGEWNMGQGVMKKPRVSCSQWTSAPIPINSDDARILFPTENDEKKQRCIDSGAPAHHSDLQDAERACAAILQRQAVEVAKELTEAAYK